MKKRRFTVKKMNFLMEDGEYVTDMKKYNDIVTILNDLYEINKELEKECYSFHMASMFSTVKSFRGDVSKRYTYNSKHDIIYDTANNYGSYDKVLDKKETAMLLNEYETLLKEKDEDIKELEEKNDMRIGQIKNLEAKIVRLKDRVKTFEKHYSLKDIERYKKMDNCNCISSRWLEE